MPAPVTAVTLDLEVLHRGRHEDRFQASGDPDDPVWLQGRLRGWLAARKWQESRWAEFELIARRGGEWKQLAKVRA